MSLFLLSTSFFFSSLSLSHYFCFFLCPIVSFPSLTSLLTLYFFLLIHLSIYLSHLNSLSHQVLNVAVRVDGRPSMSCVAGFLNRPEIILRSLKLKNNSNSDRSDHSHNINSENNNNDNNSSKNEIQNDSVSHNQTASRTVDIKKEDTNHDISNEGRTFPSGGFEEVSVSLSDDYEGDTIICKGIKDFLFLNNPNAPCVLLKAVVVVLGIVKTNKRNESKGDKKVNDKIIKGKRDRDENEKEADKEIKKEKERNKEDKKVLNPTHLPCIEERSEDCSEVDTFLSNLLLSIGTEGKGLEIVCCSELPAGSGKYCT